MSEIIALDRAAAWSVQKLKLGPCIIVALVQGPRLTKTWMWRGVVSTFVQHLTVPSSGVSVTNALTAASAPMPESGIPTILQVTIPYKESFTIPFASFAEILVT